MELHASLLFSTILSFLTASEAYTYSKVAPTCQQDGLSLKKGILTVNVEKTSSGEWVISFVGEKRLQPTSSAVNLHLTHSVVQCGNDRVLRIEGFIKDNVIGDYPTAIKPGGDIQTAILDQIPWHNKNRRFITLNTSNKGKNVEIDANGISVYRTSPLTDSRDFAGAVTNIPLEEEQTFEIRIDSVIDRHDFIGYVMVFGVVLNPPKNIGSTKYIHHNKGTWAVNGDWIWIDGSPRWPGYSLSTTNLPVGTRLGAMVKKNGDLHFYKNGVDMGLVAKNVPKRVYGFVELNHYLSRASVVNE